MTALLCQHKSEYRVENKTKKSLKHPPFATKIDNVIIRHPLTSLGAEWE